MNEKNLIVEKENFLNEFGENIDILKFNADSLVKKINEEFEIVDGLIIDSPDAERVGRDNLAYMRKVRKNIDDVKKAVKKTEMADYNKFEKEIKKMFSAIDDKINPLSEKVDAQDKKRIDAKLKELSEYWEELSKNKYFSIPVESVLFSEWSNKGKKIEDIKNELEQPATELKFIAKIIDNVDNPIIRKAAEIKATELLTDFNYSIKEKISDYIKDLEGIKEDQETTEEFNLEFKNAPEKEELTDDDLKIESFTFEISGKRHELKKVFSIMNNYSSISKKLISK